MPRFGAEGIPNALEEQIYREILKGMMGKEPLSGSDNLFNNEYIQEFSQDPGIRGPEMQYGSIEGPIVNERMRPPGKFDDSKTDAQRRADGRARVDAYVYGKMPMVSPFHQNNLPPQQGEEADSVGATTMNRMYNTLPNQLNRYPMMEMPPPDQNAQMEQLMQYYTDENI